MTSDSKGNSQGPQKKGVVRYAETESFGFRIKRALRDDLDLIAEFEHQNSTSDLVRGWTLGRASDYRHDARFQSWLTKREKEKAKGEEALKQGKLLASVS